MSSLNGHREFGGESSFHRPYSWLDERGLTSAGVREGFLRQRDHNVYAHSAMAVLITAYRIFFLIQKELFSVLYEEIETQGSLVLVMIELRVMIERLPRDLRPIH